MIKAWRVSLQQQQQKTMEHCLSYQAIATIYDIHCQILLIINVIGAGGHLYIYMCVYMIPKSLNDILAVYSPFQTLIVDLSSHL